MRTLFSQAAAALAFLAALPAAGEPAEIWRHVPAPERGVLAFWLLFLLLLAGDALLCRTLVRAALRRRRRLRLRNLQPLFLLQAPLLVVLLAVSALFSQAAAAPAPAAAATTAGAETEAGAALRALAVKTVQKLNIHRRHPETAAAEAEPPLPGPPPTRPGRGGTDSSPVFRKAAGRSVPPEAGAGARLGGGSLTAWIDRLREPVRSALAGWGERRKRVGMKPVQESGTRESARIPTDDGIQAPVRMPAVVRQPAPAVQPADPGTEAEEKGGSERAILMTVAPGQPPPFLPADILFVHAHPDDESLDFGALMARAAQAGRVTAAVLFTDGEGGNDRYPRRPVRDGYPDRRLRGKELAALRVREAQRALSLLGCRLYLRLGLPNHPYNTQRDRLTLEEVMESWGGEEALAARLADIIRCFEPGVVVGPQRSGAGPEHFEHEAVGHVLALALERLAAEGGPMPRGALACVDPRRKSSYGNLLAVPVERDAGGGESFRATQLRALRQYASQQDAVLGSGWLSRYREEYYLPLKWQDGLSWRTLTGG